MLTNAENTQGIQPQSPAKQVGDFTRIDQPEADTLTTKKVEAHLSFRGDTLRRSGSNHGLERCFPMPIPEIPEIKDPTQKSRLADLFTTEDLGNNPYAFDAEGHESCRSEPGIYGLFLASKRVEPDILQKHIESGNLYSYINGQLQYRFTEIDAEKQIADQISSIINNQTLNLQERFDVFIEYMEQVAEKIVYNIQIPDWAYDATAILHLIVDRYYNEKLTSPDPKEREEARRQWSELQGRTTIDTADNSRFAGGTINGLIEKIPEIKAMGISTVYICPPFEATTIHGYNTSDPLSVSHKLAGFTDEEYFHAFPEDKARMKSKGILQLMKLKKRIRVILDISPNHTGTDFFAYKDPQFSYWYRRNPGNGDISYWCGVRDLPELNHFNPEVQKYFLGQDYSNDKPFEEQSENWKKCVRDLRDEKTWEEIIKDPKKLEQAQRSLGVIGFWSALGFNWRFDVPAWVDRQDFWTDVRQLVTKINPELLLIGENWPHEQYWKDQYLNRGTFHSTMNYVPTEAVLNFFVGTHSQRMQHELMAQRAKEIDSQEFAIEILKTFSRYPKFITPAAMINLASHDTASFGDLIHDNTKDISHELPAMAILLTLPGIPSIWQGDDIGQNNMNSQDSNEPMSRKPYGWEFITDAEGKYMAVIPENEISGFVKKLLQLRKEHSALRSPNIGFIDIGNPDVVVMLRYNENDIVVIIANRCEQNMTITFPPDFVKGLGHLTDFNLNNEDTEQQVINLSSFEIPANSARILVPVEPH